MLVLTLLKILKINVMEGVMFRYLSYGYKEIGDQKRLERPPGCVNLFL